ncbi:hypothetical protein [Nonomuraea terrae]|uniref:hypothetical protein n=1 Tax=Nonomuraea terrae TaxID=2530383 RepID=UPI001CB6D817|nr:hypothetical protein [Nonomuraea terrae]
MTRSSSSNVRSGPPDGGGVRKSAIQWRPSAARTSSAVTGSAASRSRKAGRWASSQARSPGCAGEPVTSVIRAAMVSDSGDTVNRPRASVSALTCQ